MKRMTYALVLFVGVALGVAATLWVMGPSHRSTPTIAEKPLDPRSTGLPKPWLAFGYFGQALFTGRMLAQWIATERRRRSVVPVLFWWLSLFGGAILLIYFVRRGDPVGVLGQVGGLVVYLRNLVLLAKHPPAEST